VIQNGPEDAPAAAPAGPATSADADLGGGAMRGATDLLGALAYALLVAFFRLVEDASLAEVLADKAALGEMAVAEFGHFQLVRARLQELNVDPDEAMRPFVAAIDEFHARTAPSDWLESLVKAYAGDGMAVDFCRAAAQLLDPRTAGLVLEVLGDTGHAEFAEARLREAIAADPAVAGRLALWARRLVGEALGQAQRLAAERTDLAAFLAGGEVTQLGEIGRIFARLTDAHARRMAALGLGD
jgi:tRNA-(MS[2]IO[6]A)-hydroxylase (MiaE)-like